MTDATPKPSPFSFVFRITNAALIDPGASNPKIFPTHKFHAIPIDLSERGHGLHPDRLAAAMDARDMANNRALFLRDPKGGSVRVGWVAHVYHVDRVGMFADLVFAEYPFSDQNTPIPASWLAGRFRLEPVYQLDVLLGPDPSPGPVEGRLLRRFVLIREGGAE